MSTRSLAIAAVLLTTALVPPDAGRASAATTQASSVSFVGGLTSWAPSGNATIIRPTTRTSRLVQVAPRRTAGRKTISMRSRLSAEAVAVAGTSVTASARLRVSQPGRRLSLRIQEVNGGRVVASRSTTVKPSTRGWRPVSVTLRTTRAGSRIRLQAQAKRV
ncbi:MAG: hypothetical protein ABW075_05150, partial [Aeromicrobium sp.]